MSRLIVLSNRVKMPGNQPMAGGLAVALQEALAGNSVVWMGWNGEIVDNDNANDFNQSKVASEAKSQITYMTTALTTEHYQHFYCGFANNVLWPLLHEQPQLMNQAFGDYAGYQAVNRLFAQQLKKIIKPDDVIWVHDYHFLSVAYHCRQLGIHNRIGFFLHIPFVSLTFWQQLEQADALIHHLAHFDVVGTQTQQGKNHCLTVFKHYLKDRFIEEQFIKDQLIKNSVIEDSILEHNHFDRYPINVLSTHQYGTNTELSGSRLLLNLALKPQHSILIDAYPIGINVAKIQQQIRHLPSSLSLPSNAANRAVKQIIAVDRIDYSKGLLRRFDAYRDFLTQYPRYQNRLQLLQIACPSRLDLPTYQRLYAEVKQRVYDVNQQFSPIKSSVIKDCRINKNDMKSDDIKNEWQAIQYSESVVNHESLMTTFWQSDIGWVNSLKDGMNLVAKEYIAAQNPDDPGVLLLSHYAGAAEQMQNAVIIDPKQPTSVIEGLKMALTMPLEERKSRHRALLQGLQQEDLYAWQQRFLDDLYLNDLYDDKQFDNKKGPIDTPPTDIIQMSDS